MGLSRSQCTRSTVALIPLRRTAIAIAAGLALSVPGGVVRAEPALPAGLTDAVGRDLGLTAGEYLRRAELGQRVARFAADARQRYPLAFAGAWLDGATPVAALTAAEGADAARRAARAAGFEVRAAERSEVALGRDRTAFDGWLADQRCGARGRRHQPGERSAPAHTRGGADRAVPHQCLCPAR
ncbi:hypothetical protein [Nocardia sp. CC227C]|uniref:hypothetical protein n=1 Tax=Nocardia sp. CC227C TaxID=3044562 RepID=UPI00278C699C|nr:hypothetical protein [Nocardia sp. CC227C]